jgi:hypothetical protein
MLKYRSLPYLVEVFFGSQLPALFILKDGTSTMIASTSVPERNVTLAGQTFTSAKIACVSLCHSSR